MLNNQLQQNYIIFTDLDATLLNHNDYSFADAKEMLSYIKTKNIPLIIVTSKTKDEVILLQKDLDISYAFIIENGAGVFIPQDDSYKMIALGKQYSETLSFFKKYSKKFDIKGFHQMSSDEISNLTGLSLEKAKLAKKRTFSEPFIFKNENDFESLKKIALKDGFDIVKGGRFYHLISKAQDKAKAVNFVKELYEKKENQKLISIALGDSENDLTMLESVDNAFLIQKADKTYTRNSIKNLIKSKYQGPKGWNQVLKEFFNVK